MGTENERKYVLLNSSEVLQNIASDARRILSIEQAYIQSGKGWNIRVRKTFGIHFEIPEYELTYKHQVNKRIIEVETVIDERDYNDLFGAAFTTLNKTRYVIPMGPFKWEIDFFYDFKRTEVYFVMAEVELPERITKPSALPNFITEHLLFEVPIDNNKFSSLKLSDREYAVRKYNELIGM